MQENRLHELRQKQWIYSNLLYLIMIALFFAFLFLGLAASVVYFVLGLLFVLFPIASQWMKSPNPFLLLFPGMRELHQYERDKLGERWRAYYASTSLLLAVAGVFFFVQAWVRDGDVRCAEVKISPPATVATPGGTGAGTGVGTGVGAAVGEGRLLRLVDGVQTAARTAEPGGLPAPGLTRALAVRHGRQVDEQGDDHDQRERDRAEHQQDVQGRDVRRVLPRVRWRRDGGTGRRRDECGGDQGEQPGSPSYTESRTRGSRTVRHRPRVANPVWRQPCRLVTSRP
jgi:hypothetical protein